eukprot:1795856-Rhodomonas_salina.2
MRTGRKPEPRRLGTCGTAPSREYRDAGSLASPLNADAACGSGSLEGSFASRTRSRMCWAVRLPGQTRGCAS